MDTTHKTKAITVKYNYCFERNFKTRNPRSTVIERRENEEGNWWKKRQKVEAIFSRHTLSDEEKTKRAIRDRRSVATRTRAHRDTDWLIVMLYTDTHATECTFSFPMYNYRSTDVRTTKGMIPWSAPCFLSFRLYSTRKPVSLLVCVCVYVYAYACVRTSQ